MSASIFFTHEDRCTSPAREEVRCLGRFGSLSKAAADSTMKKGIGAPAECDAATAELFEESACEVRVKSTAHHGRCQPRCYIDASATLQAARSEPSSCARQNSAVDAEESAPASATGAEMQDIPNEAAGGEPLHSGAGSKATPLFSKRPVLDVPPYGCCSDAGNVSSPTLAATTVNSIGCTEVLPTAAVTMWVPTQFTTAAGRAICVRERRLLTAESSYWKLLRFNPSREAIVALPSSLADKCDHDEGVVFGDSGEFSDAMLAAKRAAEQLPTGAAAALGGAIDQASFEGVASATSPLTSTYVGYPWVHRSVRRRRATSCPERVVSSQLSL
nr:unnamed protein product [Leishmania braziliensis]